MRLTRLFALLCALPGAELPEELRRLEHHGRVTYEDYDPAREPRAYPARADFHYQLDRGFDFRYRTTPLPGGRVRIAVELTITRVDVQITHTIELPRGWDPYDPAHRKVMAHEYDHVAISSDPRARRLLERLLDRPITAEFTLDAGGEAEIKARLDRIHADDLKLTFDLVSTLVDGHYQRLDALTRHGFRPLPDREGFFEALYAPETLRQAGFPDDIVAEAPASPGAADAAALP